MDRSTHDLAQSSADLLITPTSGYRDVLVRRRGALDALATRQTPPSGAQELADALRCGSEARSRLMAELGALRARLEDLRHLRAGLGRLRPPHTTSPSLDIRL
jgi:hypothetical protein